jgi:hypothetical protein
VMATSSNRGMVGNEHERQQSIDLMID